jgi:hypothetical protein
MGSSGSVSLSPRGEYASAPNINPTISGISTPTASIVLLDYPVQKEDPQSLLTGNTPDSLPIQNEHTTIQITTQESHPPPSKIASNEAVELPPQRPTKPLLHLQPPTHEAENSQEDIFDSFPTPESDEDAVPPPSQQPPSNPSLHRQPRILRRQKTEPPHQEDVFDSFEAPATKRVALEQQIGASPPPPPSQPPPRTAAQSNPNPPRPPKPATPKMIYVPKKPIQLFGRPHSNDKVGEELMQRDVG